MERNPAAISCLVMHPNSGPCRFTGDLLYQGQKIRGCDFLPIASKAKLCGSCQAASIYTGQLHAPGIEIAQIQEDLCCCDQVLLFALFYIMSSQLLPALGANDAVLRQGSAIIQIQGPLQDSGLCPGNVGGIVHAGEVFSMVQSLGHESRGRGARIT